MDGNLVTYQNGNPIWSSNTLGTGYKVVFMNQAPWIEILDVLGNVVWSAKGVAAPPTTSLHVSTIKMVRIPISLW
jgi:hypothetical protein